MADYVEHMFMPGQTIQAAIKKYNKYPPEDVVAELVIKFNEINGSTIPRPGMKCKIPLLKEVQND